MSLVIIFLCAAFAFYALAAGILSIALLRAKFPSVKKYPSVSVVVAARNESRNIEKCIESLSAQNYPAEKYEIIVADDRSDDGTEEILDRMRGYVKNLRVIHIETVPDGVSPKKNALTAAIEIASGEIIAQTDADCSVPSNWLSDLTGLFTEKVGMVIGVAPYYKGPGLLNSFIRHEYLWNAALLAASAALGRPSHSCARNLAFRRDIFTEIGGYGDKAGIASGDDTLLMHNIVSRTNAKIVPMLSSSSHVYTQKPRNFPGFPFTENPAYVHWQIFQSFAASDRRFHLWVSHNAFTFNSALFILERLVCPGIARFFRQSYYRYFSRSCCQKKSISACGLAEVHS